MGNIQRQSGKIFQKNFLHIKTLFRTYILNKKKYIFHFFYFFIEPLPKYCILVAARQPQAPVQTRGNDNSRIPSYCRGLPLLGGIHTGMRWHRSSWGLYKYKEML